MHFVLRKGQSLCRILRLNEQNSQPYLKDQGLNIGKGQGHPVSLRPRGSIFVIFHKDEPGFF